MIRAFLDSWELFHLTWISGWLIAFLLAFGGIVVVARQQVFVGAAVAQSSTFGVAVALWLGGTGATEDLAWTHGEAFPAVAAVLFSVAATFLAARGGPGQAGGDAVTGWLFLVSASGSILVVARSPHALEEVHRLVASSIIGATGIDVAVFAALAAVTLLLVLLVRRPLLFTVVDPETAAALGYRTGAWMHAFGLWLGLAVGLSIRASGMIFTFGSLVLPALVARSLCREMQSLFVAAPLVGLLGSGAGFVLANHWDLPPAQVTVALECLMLAAAAPASRRRR